MYPTTQLNIFNLRGLKGKYDKGNSDLHTC